MINRLLKIFIAGFLLSTGFNLYASVHFERALSEDIDDGHLDRFKPIEAAFILSGVSTPDSLTFYVSWYYDLLKTIQNFHFDPFKPVESAQQVFAYLHGNWLKKYQIEATTLLDVVQRRTFNCVSATILYNLICDDMG